MSSARPIIEVLLFGGVAVWILTAIPGAVLCVQKQEWGGFIAGFFTIGLAWVIYGAVLLPRRHLAPAVAIAGCSIVLLGGLATRPTPIVGLDGRALDNSLGGDGPFYASTPCERLAGSEWRCGRYEPAVSGPMPYRVKVNWLGCWTATRELRKRSVGPVRYKGCVSVVDSFLYLF